LAKTDNYVIAIKFRNKVEMLFAHLKGVLGLGRLRLRGLCGANGVRFGLIYKLIVDGKLAEQRSEGDDGHTRDRLIYRESFKDLLKPCD
jgi:hypothetical protein